MKTQNVQLCHKLSARKWSLDQRSRHEEAQIKQNQIHFPDILIGLVFESASIALVVPFQMLMSAGSLINLFASPF